LGWRGSSRTCSEGPFGWTRNSRPGATREQRRTLLTSRRSTTGVHERRVQNEKHSTHKTAGRAEPAAKLSPRCNAALIVRTGRASCSCRFGRSNLSVRSNGTRGRFPGAAMPPGGGSVKWTPTAAGHRAMRLEVT